MSAACASLREAPVEVAVVRTIDELMQVFTLRAQVYVAEQNCPYREEFDGNDIAGATHLLAYAAGEPIATMRMRWFADFVKFERICVRRPYRGGRAASALIEFGCRMAARKGYSKVLAHANERLLAHWERIARMSKRPGRASFRFSDVGYFEVERDLEPVADAITINTPPLQLLRPEGDWDRPGVLDVSARRAPRGGRAR